MTHRRQRAPSLVPAISEANIRFGQTAAQAELSKFVGLGEAVGEAINAILAVVASAAGAPPGAIAATAGGPGRAFVQAQQAADVLELQKQQLETAKKEKSEGLKRVQNAAKLRLIDRFPGITEEEAVQLIEEPESEQARKLFTRLSREDRTKQVLDIILGASSGLPEATQRQIITRAIEHFRTLGPDETLGDVVEAFERGAEQAAAAGAKEQEVKNFQTIAGIISRLQLSGVPMDAALKQGFLDFSEGFLSEESAALLSLLMQAVEAGFQPGGGFLLPGEATTPRATDPFGAAIGAGLPPQGEPTGQANQGLLLTPENQPPPGNIGRAPLPGPIPTVNPNFFDLRKALQGVIASGAIRGLPSQQRR